MSTSRATTSIGTSNPYKRFVTANTLTKSIADHLGLATVVGVVGIVFGIVMGAIYAPLADTMGDLFDSVPDVLLGMIGGADMSTPEGWFEGEMYAITGPFIIIGLAAWSAARAFAGEVEDKSIGLSLAAPISRTRLGFDKVVAMLIHVSIGTLGFFLGTWIGVTIADLDINTSGILAMNLHLAALGAFFGSVALLVAVVTARKVIAVLIAFGLAVFSYAWAGFVPLADAIAWLAPLSPWFHYNGSSPLADGFDWGSIVLLVSLTAVLVVVSLAVFKRRDIAA